MEPICKCTSCVHSETLKEDFNLPYRYIPSAGQKVLHLLIHFSVPVIGAFFIGASWWALIPFAAFLVTYVVNSFWFCPGCSYHHEHAGLCGCFPRSVFPYKKKHTMGTCWKHYWLAIVNYFDDLSYSCNPSLSRKSECNVLLLDIFYNWIDCPWHRLLSRMPTERSLLSGENGGVSKKNKVKTKWRRT